MVIIKTSLTGTTNVLSQGDTTSSSKTSESAKKKLSKLSNLPASDAIKSTNDTLPKTDKKESSSVRPLLRLSSSKSEPHMTQKRAWPAATTVLAQAASSGKAKNRYIDILIPRYAHPEFSINVSNIQVQKSLFEYMI